MKICRAATAVSSLLLAQAAFATPIVPQAVIRSPDGRIEVQVEVRDRVTYSVRAHGQIVLQNSQLGVLRDDTDLTRGLDVTPAFRERIERPEVVKDSYELPTIKRRLNQYVAHRRVIPLQNQAGARMDVEFQVSNDGFAFRYLFPETDAKVRRITREATSFNFLPDARAFLQPLAPPRSGWNETNPSYEEVYDRDQKVGTLSLQGGPFVFPALFRSGETWLLVSETGVGRNYCGSRLRPQRRSSEYLIDFPTELENSGSGPATPESTLPWKTPWRLVVIGSLKTIVESTLGTDLADKPTVNGAPFLNGPGKASWSWPLLGDDNTVVPVQKRFIDYAARMKMAIHAGRFRLGPADRLRRAEGAGGLRATEGREDPHLVQLGRARGTRHRSRRATGCSRAKAGARSSRRSATSALPASRWTSSPAMRSPPWLTTRTSWPMPRR